ncbi:MAG: DegV family EDD domain-containing protein, partial [Blautia sp.]|nr:DegV family EDD domain-containing protein [Blautia sp.]
MKWNIVCDSSCDLSAISDAAIGYHKVPFIISSGTTDFVDDQNLVVSDMIHCVENEPTITHTSCPSPMSWYDKYMLGDVNIAITISKALSGSYNSAMVAKEMLAEDHPEKKVTVLDTFATSGNAILLVQELVNLIHQGLSYEEVIERAQAYVAKEKCIFSLCSFDNLIKNGRMNKITGFIASKLGFWGLGIGDEGKIKIIGKVRGAKTMFKRIITDMEERGLPQNKIVISHCLNASLAEELKETIKEKWH